MQSESVARRVAACLAACDGASTEELELMVRERERERKARGLPAKIHPTDPDLQLMYETPAGSQVYVSEGGETFSVGDACEPTDTSSSKITRGVRERFTLTGRQLGDICGVSQKAVYQWEGGERDMQRPTLKLIWNWLERNTDTAPCIAVDDPPAGSDK